METEDSDHWSDWEDMDPKANTTDIDPKANTADKGTDSYSTNRPALLAPIPNTEQAPSSRQREDNSKPLSLSKKTSVKKPVVDDFSQLDIKSTTKMAAVVTRELDFFADMEPEFGKARLPGDDIATSYNTKSKWRKQIYCKRTFWRMIAVEMVTKSYEQHKGR